MYAHSFSSRSRCLSSTASSTILSANSYISFICHSDFHLSICFIVLYSFNCHLIASVNCSHCERVRSAHLFMMLSIIGWTSDCLNVTLSHTHGASFNPGNTGVRASDPYITFLSSTLGSIVSLPNTSVKSQKAS